MGLYCGCDYNDWEPEPGVWFYWFSNQELDFEKFDMKRRKRCVSCGQLINIGSQVIKYHRYRYPYNDIEANILGCDPELNEEPPIKVADHFHCENCGEIYLNLTSVGYECLAPNESMTDSLKKYHEISGFEAERIKK